MILCWIHRSWVTGWCFFIHTVNFHTVNFHTEARLLVISINFFLFNFLISCCVNASSVTFEISKTVKAITVNVNPGIGTLFFFLVFMVFLYDVTFFMMLLSFFSFYIMPYPIAIITPEPGFRTLNIVRFYDVAWDVQTLLRRLRMEWISALEVEVDSIIGDKQVVLLDEDGFSTYIPSYSSYNETWIRSGFINPFEIDWIEFDPFKPLSNRYIELVLDVLDDQSGLWSTTAVKCKTFTLFEEWVELLRLLYQYSMDGSTSDETGTDSDDGLPV